MSWLPRTLGMRLLLALLVAVVAIVALSVLVERFDPAPRPTKRAKPEPLESRAVAVGAAANDDIPSASDAPAPPAYESQLGFRLQATAGTIMLVQREASLPPDIAPVMEVLSSGQLLVRRPMPIAAGPILLAPLSRDGHGAGLVLPVTDLADLTPASRSALVGLLRQWLRERPVPPAKLLSNDLQWTAATMQRLLSWVP